MTYRVFLIAYVSRCRLICDICFTWLWEILLFAILADHASHLVSVSLVYVLLEALLLHLEVEVFRLVFAQFLSHDESAQPHHVLSLKIFKGQEAMKLLID
jgi:hypothetical protein